jgi:hypothetical protein
MPGSSTAARLVSSTNTYGAAFTGVWNDPGYTPMALAAPKRDPLAGGGAMVILR